jgi:hypothetical protein
LTPGASRRALGDQQHDQRDGTMNLHARNLHARVPVYFAKAIPPIASDISPTGRIATRSSVIWSINVVYVPRTFVRAVLGVRPENFEAINSPAAPKLLGRPRQGPPSTR